MPTSTEDLAVVDEKTWNAWMEKGKLREAARARKMKLALGVVICLLGMGYALLPK